MLNSRALKLALKIDVDTLRATRDGVPRLVELLRRHEAGATFFFSVGPDHASGVASLITALPGRDIGRSCAKAMRSARDAGFEVGLQAWDAARWRREVAGADSEWTAHQMGLAMMRFEEVFGERPTVHGAAGWKMNRHAYRNTQAFAFDYASDTRGTHPFIPVVSAEIVACPQVPTTLPTLDEVDASGVLEKTAQARPHVFTLRAASKAVAKFETLIEGWKAQGYELVALRDFLAELAAEGLPMHTLAGGAEAVQGPEFLPPT